MLPRIIERLQSVKGPDGGGWYTALCPFHADREHPNLRFNEHGFKCMACGEAGNIAVLAARLGVETRGRFEERVVAAYDYRDEHGAVLFQTVRLRNPKDFRQRRPDGSGGWIWNLKGVCLVPYRLPEVLAADPTQAPFVVEGEKDADRLWAEGIPATTNPMGAGKWRDVYAEHLRGRSVVVIPDNDEPGRRHAEQVARSLRGVAAEVRILELPGIPEKGDVSDWLAAGGTVVELLAMADHAPAYEPAETTVPSEQPRYPRTDAGNAELFAHQYADRLRFDHRRRKWLVWDGQRWRDDADAEVVRLAVVSARHRALDAVRIEEVDDRTREAKFAIASENRARLDSMLEIAQAQPALADSGTGWDADPSLLGAANGVVDLRTGELHPGRPEDRMTMRTDVAYDPAALAPRWERFLREVFPDDPDLLRFIQEAVGYSLTGDTSEQCLFVCYGTGANGKSVFLSVLRLLAGDYTFNAPFASLERRSQPGIPNDLAALAGRRLVTSSETNEGTRLNEARIKALTGCDPITARFLHAEFFTFVPVAKYWLAVNHKPVVSDDSVGFWRRVRLIPFTRQFRGDAADKGLQRALEGELPGILAWAVRGALAWRERGSLATPVVVQEATDAYRSESDPLAAFVEERCITGPDVSVGASELFRAYRAWADDQRLGPRETLSSTTFGGRMAAKFDRRRSKRGNAYVGVGLYTDRSDPHDDAGVGVQGLVQGCESNGGEIEVFSQENRSSRGDHEKPYTTLHPTPEDDPRCAGCGREMSVVRVSDRCGYCKVST